MDEGVSEALPSMQSTSNSRGEDDERWGVSVEKLKHMDLLEYAQKQDVLDHGSVSNDVVDELITNWV